MGEWETRIFRKISASHYVAAKIIPGGWDNLIFWSWEGKTKEWFSLSLWIPSPNTGCVVALPHFISYFEPAEPDSICRELFSPYPVRVLYLFRPNALALSQTRVCCESKDMGPLLFEPWMLVAQILDRRCVATIVKDGWCFICGSDDLIGGFQRHMKISNLTRFPLRNLPYITSRYGKVRVCYNSVWVQHHLSSPCHHPTINIPVLSNQSLNTTNTIL